MGCGHLGKWHVEKVISHESSELVAIVENSDEGVEKAKELFPNSNVVKNLDEILEDIDAALIVTPTSFHFEVAQKLINAGKHVFCEKPLTDSLKTSKDLEKNKVKNLVFQVGHSERFHPVWKTLKNNPELESVFSKGAVITIDRYAPFKGRATDVDVVSDLMIHDLDLLWYLFNEKPVQISATGYKVNTDKWDHVTAVIDFKSGKRAILTSGRCHVEEQRKLEVVGEGGTLSVDLMNNTFSYGLPGNGEESIVKDSYERADHLFEEQGCFYDSILNGNPSVVPIEDGVLVVSWIDAVQKSLSERKTVTL